MKKKLLALLFVLWLFAWFGYAGRVDSILYCSINNDQVSVWLAKGKVPCQSYLQRLWQVESELSYSIRVVESYLDSWKNAFYWRSLLADLVMRKQQTAAMTNRIRLAMNDYKVYLYRVIRPKVLAVLEKEKARCRSSWSLSTPVLGCWYGQDGFLQRIASSDELEWMLDLLLEYNSMKKSYGYG